MITANIQPVHMAIMEGEQEIFFTEQQALGEVFNEVPLWIRPQSFFQTNPTVASRLYATARDCARAAGPAYVGSVLRRRRFWPALRDAGDAPDRDRDCPGSDRLREQSAAQLGLGNLHFQALDSTRFATHEADIPQLVLVNPPRRGIGAELCDYLSRMAPPYIIYSSCNARTMATDIARLSGYRVERVQLFDMFPHTAHYEVLTLLVREV